ncbi:hypothetical protein JRO89_XS13G0116500 [Xanthoceras sorbifolium]|uniref:Uncharacterized protein n=1 Tax=Xanthoceras sorbifolium TaxID=99658 RepID=A0ABQ8H7X5_9ROSI|nr:hypothetical protein JRO89_XS13G0116500 [Xanthoceras sorbifolium]
MYAQVKQAEYVNAAMLQGMELQKLENLIETDPAGKQNLKACIRQSHADLPEMKPSVVLEGSAKDACNVPPVGVVGIGVSEDAYLFQVAVLGLCNDQNEVSNLHQKIKAQQLCQPGPFTISFTLLGPVDPPPD